MKYISMKNHVDLSCNAHCFDEAYAWCWEHFGPPAVPDARWDSVIWSLRFYFENTADAALFKLRWC